MSNLIIKITESLPKFLKCSYSDRLNNLCIDVLTELRFSWEENDSKEKIKHCNVVISRIKDIELLVNFLKPSGYVADKWYKKLVFSTGCALSQLHKWRESIAK